MENASHIDLVNPNLSADEKLALVNQEWHRLYEHFTQKASKGKKQFYFYKYASILLAACTAIAASLQVIYDSQFPPWVLPIISAGATVAVAFLGASSAQKIWINSKTTGQQLQTEKFLFNQRAANYRGLSDVECIRIFSERLVLIWNAGHQKWEQHVGGD